MIRKTLLAGLILSACTPYSETVGGAAPVGTVWVLEKINDRAFPARATLQFQSNGQVTGIAPCNSFSARQTAPLPWFEVESISVTRAACDQLSAESEFLRLLEAMDFAEIGGTRMLLSNSAGNTLLFSSERPNS